LELIGGKNQFPFSIEEISMFDDLFFKKSVFPMGERPHSHHSVSSGQA